MEKILYFNNSKTVDCCAGTAYYDFIDYAFEKNDYFMLVYVNYYGKGFTRQMKDFRKALQSFQVKTRSNPSWPGVLSTSCANTSYKIVFYRCHIEAKDVLKKVSKMSDWACPDYPQDLAFFKGNTCWFYSVGHEKIAAILHANKEDVAFLKSRNLVAGDADGELYNSYYDLYNEKIIE